MNDLKSQRSAKPSALRAQRRWLTPVCVALICAGLMMAWRYTPFSKIDVVLSYAHAAALKPWMPLAVSLAYIPAGVLMFPQTLVTLFAVAAFGARTGFVCAVSGVVIAALVMYFCGTMSRGDSVHRWAGSRLGKIVAIMRERGILSIFTLRFFPIAPFAVSSWIAGAMRVKLWQYVLGTILGILPGMIVVTLIGSQAQAYQQGASGEHYLLVAAVVLMFAAGIATVKRQLTAKDVNLHAPQ